MTTVRRKVILVAAVALGSACGVPTGPDSFDPIDGSDVPNRLNDTTTTTSTTTTTVAVTTTTLPDQPDPTTTTTEAEIPTEFVEVFYVSRGQLRAQETEVPSPVTANDLISLLETRPSSDLLDNEIDLNLIESTSTTDGVITIELDDLVFQRIPNRDQREAIAQMVLTFLTNLRGVGQAVFVIDDVRLTVPVGNFQFTDEPVSLDDYENMLVDAAPTPATPTTTSTTTTTTVAPPDEPEPAATDPAEAPTTEA